MKTILTLAGAALVTATLAACSPGIHGKFGYSVDFQNGELVSHAPGQPNAYINADGSLRIGKRTVAVTSAQRALLKGYYGESQAIVTEGEATGKAGAKLGVHAIGNAIKSIFSSDSKQADKQLDAQANAISVAAKKLCAGIQQLHGTQQAIAAQLPAFKPYEAFDKQTQCDITTDGSTISVTSSTSSPDKAGATGMNATAH